MRTQHSSGGAYTTDIILSTDRQVQSNIPLFFEGGHNVKTGTQEYFSIQNNKYAFMQCETDKTENKSAMETTKYKVNSIVKRK
jgi:hypothetical protein